MSVPNPTSKDPNMAIFDFTENLQTSIDAMDNEHRFLFDAINHSYELIRTDKHQAYTYFDTVILNYVEKHLTHEENIMRKNNYPDFEQHLKAHTLFRKVVMELVPAVQAGDPKAFMEVYAISMGWLIGHIEKVDKKYGKWYAEQNLTAKINAEESASSL